MLGTFNPTAFRMYSCCMPQTSSEYAPSECPTNYARGTHHDAHVATQQQVHPVFLHGVVDARFRRCVANERR